MKHTSNTHHILIGAPLVLILIFCFSFVLLQPVDTGPTRSTANQTTANDGQADTDTGLPEIPLTENELPTLDTAAPVAESTPVSSSAASVASSNPQAAPKSSGSKNNSNPQTNGSARGQQVSPTAIIKVQIPNSLLR